MELSQLKTALALVNEITAFKFKVESKVWEELRLSLEQEGINPSIEISDIDPDVTLEEEVINKFVVYLNRVRKIPKNKLVQVLNSKPTKLNQL